jgi:hypothetical protein
MRLIDCLELRDLLQRPQTVNGTVVLKHFANCRSLGLISRHGLIPLRVIWDLFLTWLFVMDFH